MKKSVSIVELQQNEVSAVSGGFLSDLGILGAELLVIAGIGLWKGTKGFTGKYNIKGLGKLNRLASTTSFYFRDGNFRKTLNALSAFAICAISFRVLGWGVEAVFESVFG